MLEAMGVEHGCEVEICHVGSPCILKVDARRFGVGREVASPSVSRCPGPR